jgi:hypothetical protein
MLWNGLQASTQMVFVASIGSDVAWRYTSYLVAIGG